MRATAYFGQKRSTARCKSASDLSRRRAACSPQLVLASPEQMARPILAGLLCARPRQHASRSAHDCRREMRLKESLRLKIARKTSSRAQQTLSANAGNYSRISAGNIACAPECVHIDRMFFAQCEWSLILSRVKHREHAVFGRTTANCAIAFARPAHRALLIRGRLKP